MSWVSDLFHGDKTATNASNSLLNTGATATGEGQTASSDALNFFHSLLNGGASKTLAPQISSIQKQGSQKLQTLSQFGNRSGGTNSEAQTTGDTTRSSINDLIASLTGSAASSEASLGTNLLGIGTSSTGEGAQLSLENKSLVDSLLQSVGAGAGSALTKWALPGK